MLDQDRVCKSFLVYADLDELTPRHRALCAAAANRLAARLKPGICLAQQMDRLCESAAGLAYCDSRALGDAFSDVQEMRVGEVSLRSSASSGGGEEDLSALREEFTARVADLLLPPFVFGQVGV